MISQQGSNGITKHLPSGSGDDKYDLSTAEATWGKRPCSEKEPIGILEFVALDQQQKAD